METEIIVVFCLCADMLKSLDHYEDPQCRMSEAEVMTTEYCTAERSSNLRCPLMSNKC